MLAFQSLAALFALVMLVRHLPRALLFLVPGLVRFRAAPEAPARSPAELRAREELERLGFAPVGAIEERAPLGAVRDAHEVLADAEGLAFADLAPGRGGVRVRFVTAYADGAVHQTGDQGALAPGTLAAAWAAHRKGAARGAGAHGGLAPARDLEGRLRAARAHHARAGRAELRRGSALALFNALLAGAILAVAVKALLAGLRS